MTLDDILFNINALISQSNCNFISLEYRGVFSQLGSCNDKSVYWLQNKNMFFPSEQKKCTKCHFKSIIYILKGVWCFPRIVR